MASATIVSYGSGSGLLRPAAPDGFAICDACQRVRRPVYPATEVYRAHLAGPPNSGTDCDKPTAHILRRLPPKRDLAPVPRLLSLPTTTTKYPLAAGTMPTDASSGPWRREAYSKETTEKRAYGLDISPSAADSTPGITSAPVD